MPPKKVLPSAFAAFVVLGVLCTLCFAINSGFALLLGFLVACFQLKESEVATVSRLSKWTLACAIVAFGFTVKLGTIGALTTQYFWHTVTGILLALCAAILVGRLLGMDKLLSALIGTGTAICGASAIAAVGSATNASPAKMSMALGTVLVLNAVALLLFPLLGSSFHLSPHDFGVWAGLAVHDTSSVVGAALSFDPDSLEVATTVKLARALWIIPVTAFFARMFAADKHKKSFKVPWFIWGYLVAASAESLFVFSPSSLKIVSLMAQSAFRVGIFLTGAAVNIGALRALGIRPFLLGILLWMLSASWSLFAIFYF